MAANPFVSSVALCMVAITCASRAPTGVRRPGPAAGSTPALVPEKPQVFALHLPGGEPAGNSTKENAPQISKPEAEASTPVDNATRVTSRTKALALVAARGLRSARGAWTLGDPGLRLRQLRICNAYPSEESMTVIGQDPKTTLKGNVRVKYKECKEIATPLSKDERLRFWLGSAAAGIFLVSELPEDNNLLLIVMFRHDQVTNAASFHSHVFACLEGAQLAALDTYVGQEKATLKISNTESLSEGSSALTFGQTVALEPGSYELMMASEAVHVAKPMEAKRRESYLVVRVGAKPREGRSFPDELMVYPVSGSLSARVAGRAAALLATFLVACSTGLGTARL